MKRVLAISLMLEDQRKNAAGEPVYWFELTDGNFQIK